MKTETKVRKETITQSQVTILLDDDDDDDIKDYIRKRYPSLNDYTFDTITVQVPGGADWSNCMLDIGADTLIKAILIRTTKETEP